MKDRWDQTFFWTLESNTWVKKERQLLLDYDDTTVVLSLTSGSTSGVTF